jgi:hypothetical protein
MKRPSPALGIAAPRRKFSVCRMVNVDSRSPKFHSSLNVVIDELNGWVIELALDTWRGVLREAIVTSCRRRPGSYEEERELLVEVASLSPEKMLVVCMENLPSAQALEALLTEVELHNLAPIDIVKAAVTQRFSHCFLEPEP